MFGCAKNVFALQTFTQITKTFYKIRHEEILKLLENLDQHEMQYRNNPSPEMRTNSVYVNRQLI